MRENQIFKRKKEMKNDDSSKRVVEIFLSKSPQLIWKRKQSISLESSSVELDNESK